MVRFLSDEWVDALDRAAAAAPAMVLGPGDELVIQHVVTDVPTGGQVVYHLRLSDQPARAARGPAPDPTVTFTQTYQTAAAVAAGTSSAQAAFMEGSLRVGGRVDVMLAHHGALGGVDDAFGELRQRTEYSPSAGDEHLPDA